MSVNLSIHNRVQIPSTSLSVKQKLFDDIAALADFFISPIPTNSGQGGAYMDTTFTRRATLSGDPVLGLKGFGNAPPSIVNLPFTGLS